MSDSMNLLEKNSDFKLSKQQQFFCTYADHFSTIELNLSGKIMRYIGLEVSIYKIFSLQNQLRYATSHYGYFFGWPAGWVVFNIRILKNPADLYRERIGRENLSVRDDIGHMNTSDQMKKIYHEPIGHKICPVIIRLDRYICPIRWQKKHD